MSDVLHETAISDAEFDPLLRGGGKRPEPIVNVMALDQNISVNAQKKGRIP